MIRVLIVDDQKVVTQGLKALLESEPDIQIVGTGANGQEAIHLVSTLNPDVLLIDQYMPVMNGVEATQLLTNQFPHVAVLLLSSSDQDHHIAEAIQAGAKGYLLKTTSSEDLAHSIRSVDRGYSQMGPGLLEKLLAKINGSAASLASPETAPLSSTSALEPPLSSDLDPILSNPAQFDIAELTRLLNATHNVNMAAVLMTQMEKQLQQNPSHVSVLYLSGAVIGKFHQRNQRAINYFRLAFTHAQTQFFPLSALLHICRGAWAVNSTETLSWLVSILRAWPTDEPYGSLFEQMSQVFGAGTDPYRQLKAVWEIERLKLLCEQVDALKSKLSVLDLSA
jgi:DNA-binding NarL/FixJ family response regulator